MLAAPMLLLAGCFLGVSTEAGELRPSEKSPAAAAGLAAMRSGVTSRLAAAEEKEKKRVPRTPPPDSKGREKETKEEREESSEGHGSCWADCLWDVFFGRHHDEPTAVVAAEAPAAPSEGPIRWAIGDLAAIASTGPPGRAVDVWSGAGGAAEGHRIVGTLQPGTPVLISEVHELGYGLWFKVVREEGTEPSGWVPSPALAPRPAPPAPPPPPPAPPPRLSLRAAIGPQFWAGPPEVEQEYPTPNLHLALGVERRFSRAVGLALDVGWGWGRGDPKSDYVTAARKDSVLSLKFQRVSGALSFGLHLPVPGERWSAFVRLGPEVSWVREEADIMTVDLPSGAITSTGTQSIERVRLGGELEIGATAEIGGGNRVGARAGTSLIAWFSRGEKSLTFDFIREKTPVAVTVSLVYQRDWF